MTVIHRGVLAAMVLHFNVALVRGKSFLNRHTLRLLWLIEKTHMEMAMIPSASPSFGPRRPPMPSDQTVRSRFACQKEARGPEASLGITDVMHEVFVLIGRLAPTDLTVTLIGETGTGKDVFAHRVHQRSGRAAGPFVVFDCGAVPPNLIESELFGHERGSFTGAHADHAGAFERAEGGTLFLEWGLRCPPCTTS